MLKKLIVLTILLAWLAAPMKAVAQPRVSVEMSSEKEVAVMVEGKEVKKRVLATDIEPGQILILTLNFANNGDEKATNVVINNPIPKDTHYVVGSASKDTGELLFSIDSGQTFKKPSLLTYEIKGPDGKLVKKIASPELYTDIRWIVHEIPAGQKGKVGFKVKVK